MSDKLIPAKFETKPKKIAGKELEEFLFIMICESKHFSTSRNTFFKKWGVPHDPISIKHI